MRGVGSVQLTHWTASAQTSEREAALIEVTYPGNVSAFVQAPFR